MGTANTLYVALPILDEKKNRLHQKLWLHDYVHNHLQVKKNNVEPNYIYVKAHQIAHQ